MNLLERLNRLLDQELAAEGITPEVLSQVDLSIGYSPVIPFAGGKLESAVAVQPWGFPARDELPVQFEVLDPLIAHPVDRAALSIMRARYLLARDAVAGPRVRAVLSDLFSGVPACPPPSWPAEIPSARRPQPRPTPTRP